MPTEPLTDARIGIVIDGAYRITRLIAEGGMAAVYEAVQLRLNKRVAIKLMASRLSANRRALARFHREAEITSRLRHPHLVEVIDHGQSGTGEPYLVMEYLDGEDLDHRLRRVGRLPIEAVVRVVRQVASALNAAHLQGVVHRDLKPANIFLLQAPGETDFVKVLDFGISKVMAAHTRLTNAACAVGTPCYMSPEQATGMFDSIDHHIDQWALGCIAWEMLLGTRPFVGHDATALLSQIVRMEPLPLPPRVPGLSSRCCGGRCASGQSIGSPRFVILPTPSSPRRSAGPPRQQFLRRRCRSSRRRPTRTSGATTRFACNRGIESSRLMPSAWWSLGSFFSGPSCCSVRAPQARRRPRRKTTWSSRRRSARRCHCRR